MNEVTRQLKARKSVRAFEARPVPDEILGEILECALAAPTAGCQMLYTILHITDPMIKSALARTCDNQPFIGTAPLVLLFLADCRRWLDSYAYAGCEARAPREADMLLACADAVIAAQNAVTAAEALGLGSCYIGDIVEQRETVTQLLALDPYVFPAALLVLGYPTAQQRAREKPERFARRFIVLENAYRRLTEAEHREMFAERGEDLDAFIPAFFKRKYESAFMAEMVRSVAAYLEAFEER
ncbi:MAG: nitroreductase family protein [Oscillospiraceae bacterium]|jgi:nitroreductase|nr:nitroreductase family protein [Oscillospiraceae bacterium]